MQIFVKRNGVEEGPFTKEQLQTLLSEGKIRPIELAYHEGLSNWMPLAAVISTRELPPPFKGVSSAIGEPSEPTAKPQNRISRYAQPEFLEQREDITSKISSTFHEFKNVDWHSAFPWRHALSDRPWEFVWVRNLFVVSAIPSIAAVLIDAKGGTEGLMRLFVSCYVSLLWATGLASIARPKLDSVTVLSKSILPPLLLQTGFLIAARHVEWLSRSFASTASDSLAARLIPLLSIWTLWQSTIAASLVVTLRKYATSIRDFLYLGSISGLICSISPTLAGILDHKWVDSTRWHFLGAFQSHSIASLVATMAMGTFSGGVLGFVVFNATNSGRHQWHLAIGGVVGTAVMMTLNSLTMGGWTNVILMAIAVWIFATCIRSLAETISET